MVDAQEWLNNNISKEKREQVKNLYIYQQENNNYSYNYNNNQPSTYYFYSTLLEGKLDFSDFVNLEQLSISGIGNGHNQQQEVTGLKVDKCSKMTSLTINFTTLTNLNIDKNVALQSLNCSNNQLSSLNTDKNISLQTLTCNSNRLSSLNLSNNSNLNSLNYENNWITYLDINNTKLTNVARSNKVNFYNSQTETELRKDKEQIQSQVKKLIGKILVSEDLGKLKLEVKKIEQENLTHQLTKKKNELEQFLAKEVLTNEEVKNFLSKQTEINELEGQLSRLKIQDAQVEVPPK